MHLPRAEAKNAAKNLANESSSKMKARDEVTLEYIFVKAGAENVPITNQLKARAKNDDEDIFSRLIEQAAEPQKRQHPRADV